MIHHIGKVLTWRSQILNVTMIQHPHLKLYHFKPQTFKRVEIVKISDKLTYDTSYWKGLDLEIADFKYHYDPSSSHETIPSQTSNP